MRKPRVKKYNACAAPEYPSQQNSLYALWVLVFLFLLHILISPHGREEKRREGNESAAATPTPTQTLFCLQPHYLFQ
ncbi:hypothetical protein VNO77_01859 [Canavalia gladiata]|uniref:Uncharacterized protein n=1 Tax=Canavalia gladiata TaxID=3824 RepID=A0AAN9MSK6_CANGL